MLLRIRVLCPIDQHLKPMLKVFCDDFFCLLLFLLICFILFLKKNFSTFFPKENILEIFSTNRFQNLGILFIGKKEVQEILYRRKSSSHQLNRRRLLRRTGQQQQQQCLNNHQLRRQLQLEAEKEAKDLNLNSVRIRFEAFMLCEQQQQQQTEVELETKQFFLRPLCAPVYSKPIANQSKLNENFFFMN